MQEIILNEIKEIIL